MPGRQTERDDPRGKDVPAAGGRTSPAVAGNQLRGSNALGSLGVWLRGGRRPQCGPGGGQSRLPARYAGRRSRQVVHPRDGRDRTGPDRDDQGSPASAGRPRNWKASYLGCGAIPAASRAIACSIRPASASCGSSSPNPMPIISSKCRISAPAARPRFRCRPILRGCSR